MKIRRIEHVAIVVKDLDASRHFWEDIMGIAWKGSERFPERNVEVAMYPVGESMIELVCGTTPEAAYTSLARDKGEFLHHVCLEVESLDAALAELRAKGVRLRDEVPRPGHGGARIAFLDPASTGQILIELVEARSPRQ